VIVVRKLAGDGVAEIETLAEDQGRHQRRRGDRVVRRISAG
jgi:hypothetical protein